MGKFDPDFKAAGTSNCEHALIFKNGLTPLLLDEIRASKRSVCTERAMLLTEFNKKNKTQFKSTHLKRAYGLKFILEHKQSIIYENERLIGNFTSKRVGAPFYPEMAGLVMISDYYNPFTAGKMPLDFPISDRIQVLLKIFPFWGLRNVFTRAFIPRTRNPFKILKGMKNLIKYAMIQLKPKHYFINEVGGIIHLIPDYDGLVKRGIKGYLEQVRSALHRTDSDEESDFLQSLEVVADGIVKMAANFADEAANKSDATGISRQRKEQLCKMVRICRKIPYHPPENFHEALQAILFVHIALVQETLDMSISFGRMDQYLYPLYQKEIQEYAKKKGVDSKQAKTIVNQEVQELLECFFLKTNEILPLYNLQVSRAHEGLPSFYAVTIGGMTPDGMDGENELTRVFLDVIKKIPLRQPNYHVRYSNLSKPQFMEDVVTVIKETGFTPAIINDEAIIPTLQTHLQQSNHLSDKEALVEARNYGTIGCVEIGIPGKSYPMADAAFFNLPICMVTALSKEDYKNICDMDGLKKAFIKEVRHHVDKMVQEIKLIEQTRANFYPLPLTSLLVEGCLEKALDITSGGAQYNWSSIQAIGMADTVDSFAAIKKCLDDRISLETIRQSIKNNFQTDKKLHQILSNAPKYGQDDMGADQYLDFVLNCYTNALKAAGKNTRGGSYVSGGFSSGAHQLFGQRTAALPSGRKKGFRLANGVSPTDMADVSAITATMSSVSRLNPKHYVNGYTFNQKIDPPLMENVKLFAGLIKGFFRQNNKGVQIQFNVINKEILEAARENPDKYPWLVVRVSGYSAYFKDLSPQMQDEIIHRSLKTG